MKTLLLLCFLILGLFPMNIGSASASQNLTLMTVTANKANVYESASFESHILETLIHKNNLFAIIEDDELVFDVDAYNHKFYYVKTEADNFGYVFADYITFAFTDQQEFPVFNAKVSRKNTPVYSFDGENYNIVEDITLNKNHELYLYKGYNKKLEYTPVCFVYENSLQYYYLKTNDVKPNGINPLLFVGLSVFLAIIGIIFALLFIKKKKKTPKKKKKKAWIKVKVVKSLDNKK